MAGKHVLTYFDAAARAAPVRIALHAAGVEFDDVRLSYDDFKVSCHGTGGSNRVRFLTIAC